MSGNVIGSANAGELYEEQRFAVTHDVVLVSINYRLGTLGWFSHPALQVPSSDSMAAKDNSGNYGTLISLLLWSGPENISIRWGSREWAIWRISRWLNVMSMVVSPLAQGSITKLLLKVAG